jgi:glycosyltransferase involved in cell wall biosynthesis
MKVLHITNAWPYESVPEYGVFVKEQIDSLAEIGVQSDVYFINGRQDGKLAYLKAMWRLRQRVRSYDLVHCHHLYSALVLAGVRTGRTPIVLSFLNDWMREVKSALPAWVKLAMCHFGVWRSHLVIFKSPIPAGLDPRALALHLPNGVDADFFAPGDRTAARRVLGLDLDLRYLLFVSSKNQFRTQKRYDLFQAVIAELHRRGRKDVREIVMVNQPRHRIPDFFRAADMHVLTSDYEGSPNSVKEALSSGLPVITRSVGNVVSMLKGVPHTAVVDSEDASAIADAVEVILDTPELQGCRIRESFLAKGLTRREVAEGLVAAYSRLIHMHREV